MKALTYFTILAALMFILGTPSGVEASEMKERKGFVIGFDIGGGGGHFGDTDRGAALAGFKIGGGINESILLLGEFSSAGTSINGYAVGLSGCYFSSQILFHDNFYIRPGVGFASVATDSANVTISSDSGFSFITSGGYEFRLGNRFALSPEARFGYSRIDAADYMQYGVALDMRWYF